MEKFTVLKKSMKHYDIEFGNGYIGKLLIDDDSQSLKAGGIYENDLELWGEDSSNKYRLTIPID
jgi:hypothetical protein